MIKDPFKHTETWQCSDVSNGVSETRKLWRKWKQRNTRNF